MLTTNNSSVDNYNKCIGFSGISLNVGVLIISFIDLLFGGRAAFATYYKYYCVDDADKSWIILDICSTVLLLGAFISCLYAVIRKSYISSWCSVICVTGVAIEAITLTAFVAHFLLTGIDQDCTSDYMFVIIAVMCCIIVICCIITAVRIYFVFIVNKLRKSLQSIPDNDHDGVLIISCIDLLFGGFVLLYGLVGSDPDAEWLLVPPIFLFGGYISGLYAVIHRHYISSWCFVICNIGVAIISFLIPCFCIMINKDEFLVAALVFAVVTAVRIYFVYIANKFRKSVFKEIKQMT